MIIIEKLVWIIMDTSTISGPNISPVTWQMTTLTQSRHFQNIKYAWTLVCRMEHFQLSSVTTQSIKLTFLSRFLFMLNLSKMLSQLSIKCLIQQEFQVSLIWCPHCFQKVSDSLLYRPRSHNVKWRTEWVFQLRSQ